MTNVLLVDLSSIAHPLFHVSAPPFSDVSTKTVERVRALASGMTRGVGVCVEGGRSFRKDLDPNYKANRPEGDAALYHQINLAIDILRADGFPILQAEGFEADDVIATATETMLSSGLDSITIASSDKDLLQLVRPSGYVVVKSLKDGSIIDAAAVEAKFGVRPDQMLDFLALCGDTSDNIKGCKDVGKVRAAGLLKKYGTLDGIFAALDGKPGEFTPALTESLEEYRFRCEGVCQLLRLRTDAPISIDEILKERVPTDVAEFGAESTFESARAAAGEGLLAEVKEIYEDMGGPGRRREERTDAAAPRHGGPDGGGQGGSAHRDAAEHDGTKKQDRRADSNILSHEPTTGLARRTAELVEPTPVEWERQLEPRNMAQVKLVALDMFASRLFSQYGHPAAVMATILAGREFGLPMMSSLRSFHNIDGKQTLAADLIRALVLRSGIVDYFRPTERTNERATFVAKRKGDPEISLTFTIEDARRAWQKGDKAWDGSGYNHNPADMLIARAGAKLARLVAPDVVSGLYAREELE